MTLQKVTIPYIKESLDEEMTKVYKENNVTIDYAKVKKAVKKIEKYFKDRQEAKWDETAFLVELFWTNNENKYLDMYLQFKETRQAEKIMSNIEPKKKAGYEEKIQEELETEKIRIVATRTSSGLSLSKIL